MKPEIEAKFIHVSHQDIRKRLQALGARQALPRRLMRRKNYDYPDHRLEARHGWIRLRDEGGVVTLAYKQADVLDATGTKEVSVVVDSFDETHNLLTAIGLEQKSYQETRRESWVLDSVHIELDEWPWIDPFVEIEASTEAELWRVARSLELHKADALFGGVDTVYTTIYDISSADISRWPEITFTNPPEWLAAKKR